MLMSSSYVGETLKGTLKAATKQSISCGHPAGYCSALSQLVPGCKDATVGPSAAMSVQPTLRTPVLTIPSPWPLSLEVTGQC